MRTSRIERLRQYVEEQRQFMRDCINNGDSSYYAENGAAVHEADAAYLRRLERELRVLENKRGRR